jgi:HlyD family secretion protein
MGGVQEQAGSTRIIMIKPEGTPVSAGELVCELDSAAYQDEVIAQRIRYDQAKAWVIQARSILGVNDISLREYRDGIYLQDLQLIRQYISSCRTEEDRARRNLTWSKENYLKGFRAPAQYQADVLSLERAEIALGEAERMEKRLVEYTGPKLIKSLEAKLEANRADALAQEAAFQLESDRLKRLERTVENCTLRAPRDGIVVYSLPPSNGWRPPTAVIMEGATVREGQAIFDLPDAKKMRVRARVNESKVGSIRVGQKAAIRIDAFADRVLDGTVTEVTAIPAPNGMGSDIRIYFANVAIDSGGFEGLRPGLSAEVSFFVDAHPETTRVPLQAVRWVENRPYAAVSTSPDRTSWRWQPLEIGLMNESYAEVLGGLKPGDKIVAHPQGLEAPLPPASPVVQAAGDAPARPQG